jgi:transcriptional regulator with XRE-family HTH domain
MNIASECIIVAGPVPPTIMWLANDDVEPSVANPSVEFALPIDYTQTPAKPLHRLAEVRRQERITRRTLARRMGLTLREVQEQEDPFADIRLSELYRWQMAMEVPVTELLCEPQCDLSPPIQLRAKLLLMMKTIRTIQQRSHSASLKRLVETLIGQILEVVPDLKDTAPWPMVGRRRRQRDYGQAFFRRLSLDSLDDMEGPER